MLVVVPYENWSPQKFGAQHLFLAENLNFAIFGRPLRENEEKLWEN